MDVRIGSTVSLRSDTGPDEVDSRLVGFEAPDFLIVRLPAVANGSIIQLGRSLAATFLQDGFAYQFNASVQYMLPEFRLVFLSYPRTYDSQPLRKEARVNCRIPATASIERRALKGLVTDISNHGCQFIVKIPTSFKLYRVSVLTDIHLSLSLFGPSDGSQLKGRVRNTNIDEFRIVLGIEFEKLEDQLSRRLSSFIDELEVLN